MFLIVQLFDEPPNDICFIIGYSALDKSTLFRLYPDILTLVEDRDGNSFKHWKYKTTNNTQFFSSKSKNAKNIHNIIAEDDKVDVASSNNP